MVNDDEEVSGYASLASLTRYERGLYPLTWPTIIIMIFVGEGRYKNRLPGLSRKP